MKIFPILFITLCVLTACENKQPTVQQSPKKAATLSPVKQPLKAEAPLHTDTLQFLSFDGNFDYWTADFLNAKNDTIQLVTDSVLDDRLKNKMMSVQWKTDTLTEAGDNESKYAAKRMMSFTVIN